MKYKITEFLTGKSKNEQIIEEVKDIVLELFPEKIQNFILKSEKILDNIYDDSFSIKENKNFNFNKEEKTFTKREEAKKKHSKLNKGCCTII